MNTLIVLGVLGLLLYLLPSFIAAFRRHRNDNAIAALNVLLGWTFLGWVISLVWALTDNVKEPEPSWIERWADRFEERMENRKSLRDKDYP